MVLRQIETSSQLVADKEKQVHPAIEQALPPVPPLENIVIQEAPPTISTSEQEDSPVTVMSPEKENIALVSPTPPDIKEPEKQIVVKEIAIINKIEKVAEEPVIEQIQPAVAETKAKPTTEKQPEQNDQKQRKVAEESVIEQIQPAVAETKAKPTTKKQPEQNDQKQRLDEILEKYTELYSTKKLKLFLALFTDNATENGQLQIELIDQYNSLFTHTEAIDINLGKMNWKEYQGGFQGIGTFRTRYAYKDGNTRDYAGDITFYVTYDQSELKIQSLEYVFLN